MTFAIFLVVAAAAITPTTEPPAKAAAPSGADQRFDEGRIFLHEKRFQEAAQKFAESYALESSPVTLLNLGICHEMLGQRGRAFLEFRQAAAEAGADHELLEFANGRARALEAQLPALHVTISSGGEAEAVTVAVDGIALKPELLAAPIPIDPGTHAIDARDAAGRTRRVVVRAHDHQTEEVRLKFKDELPPPIDGPRPITRNDTRTVAGSEPWCTTGCKAALGVAGAGLLGAVVTGLVAHAKRTTYDEKNGNPSADTGARTSAHDSAERWQWANLGFVGATVVGAGLGAVLIALRPSEAPSPPSRLTAVAPLFGRDRVGLSVSTEWSGP